MSGRHTCRLHTSHTSLLQDFKHSGRESKPTAMTMLKDSIIEAKEAVAGQAGFVHEKPSVRSFCLRNQPLFSLWCAATCRM